MTKPIIIALTTAVVMVVVGGAVVAWFSRSDITTPLPRPDEAQRRAAQRDRIADDLKLIAKHYKAYSDTTQKPTSGDFWAYLDAEKDAKSVCGYIREQQYSVQVPKENDGIIAFERDLDQDKTRVVALADGSVNKTMPDEEFQKSIKKGKR